MISKRHISFHQLGGYCNTILRQMSRDDWKPELIVGITRGGALPAVMISHYLGVSMITLDVALRDGAGDAESNLWVAEDALAGKRILIVDDINDTGATFNWIVSDWESSAAPGKIRWADNVRFAVVIDNEASKVIHPPQYFGELINKAEKDEWIVFPYENWWENN